MRIKKIIRLFEEGNVAVCGLRGRGKDLLTGNVIARRGKAYISNVDYGGAYNNLDFSKLDVGKNNYKDFITGDVKYYEYPYPDGTDVYISDVGIYMPAQYCNELNKDYKHLPVFFALSRHLANCNVYYNVQALNRAWDKLREQVDCYISADKCIYIKGINIVIQRVTIYDNYESALAHRDPLILPRLGLFASREAKINREIAIANFDANHGKIKRGWLIYKNKAKYNTRSFKEVLKNGKKDNSSNSGNSINTACNSSTYIGK